MSTRWIGLSSSPLLSMNIQEGGRENGAVFWLLSHRSSVAGSSAGQMTEREREMHVWDLKGTAPGCLGYLFLSKAMRCLVKEGSYTTLRTGSILLLFSPADCSLWSANVRTCLYLRPVDAWKKHFFSLYGEQSQPKPKHAASTL